MPREVQTAFSMLAEELTRYSEIVRREAVTAMDAGNFTVARAAVDKAEALLRLRSKAADLEEEWRALAAGTAVPRATPKQRAPASKQRQAGPRTPKGVLTPHAAYCRPILESLVELGGAARKSAVIAKVGQRMASILNQDDREPLKSGEPKWRNRAAWTRHDLVKAGLLKPKAQQGVWEISDQGRRWLREGLPVPPNVPGAKKMAAGR